MAGEYTGVLVSVIAAVAAVASAAFAYKGSIDSSHIASGDTTAQQRVNSELAAQRNTLDKAISDQKIEFDREQQERTRELDLYKQFHKNLTEGPKAERCTSAQIMSTIGEAEVFSDAWMGAIETLTVTLDCKQDERNFVTARVAVVKGLVCKAARPTHTTVNNIQAALTGPGATVAIDGIVARARAKCEVYNGKKLPQNHTSAFTDGSVSFDTSTPAAGSSVDIWCNCNPSSI